MNEDINYPGCIGKVNSYRTVNLSKIIDPAIEKRRCKLNRHKVIVNGVEDYHTEVDIITHLGTHVEAPYHHNDLVKDVTSFPSDHFLGRGVLLRLDTCEPNALVTRKDLNTASNGRVQAGDVIILDSRYHSEPFVENPDDKRPHLSKEASEWFLEKKVKAIGFGDGICIESNAEECIACHDILLGNDILIIEVLQNIDKLLTDIFLIIFMPLLIRGLDSSPVNVMAIENVPGFTG